MATFTEDLPLQKESKRLENKQPHLKKKKSPAASSIELDIHKQQL